MDVHGMVQISETCGASGGDKEETAKQNFKAGHTVVMEHWVLLLQAEISV